VPEEPDRIADGEQDEDEIGHRGFEPRQQRGLAIAAGEGCVSHGVDALS
jgi:hypothetical protein